MRPTTLLCLALLVLPVAVPTTAAQSTDGFRRCGADDIALVFLNPDLRVQDDGYVHASGAFFIQFQARGERATLIESIKFSFGPDASVPESCQTPEWLTGAYVKNYRADYEWRDGFFIPIDTCLVGDGTYAAAISAYDKDLNELVRYYTRALVDNGGRSSGRDPCDQPDTTAPWPMVLPGDGERLDGGQGLYIEVAEPVFSIDAWANGARLELMETSAPARDNDLVPDLGYHPVVRDSGLAEAQMQSRVYGPAYTWDGVLTPGDVVKVRIEDIWGNVAEKVVHLGDPTIGGRVTLRAPDFALEVPLTDVTADANGTATYNVTYITRDEEGLHADLYVRGAGPDGKLPEGIDYRLNPNHVMMGGNERLEGKITLIATPSVKPGTYKAVFVANYLHGDERREKEVPLTFRLDERAERDATEDDTVADKSRPIEQEQVRGEEIVTTNVDEDAPEEPQETPAAPWLLAVLAAVLLARRRRV